MKTSLLYLLAVLMCSCAHQARHITAPDNSAVIGSAAKLNTTITRARQTAIAAQSAVVAVKTASGLEGEIIQRDAVKLTALLKAAPPELREAITSVQGDNADLLKKHEDLESRITEAATIQETHAKQLAEEIPAAQSELEKSNAAYFTNADALTDRANASEAGWAKDAKSLQWYRVHWFIGIIVMIAGIALCAFVAILKFSAKTAATAATIIK